MPYFVKRIEEGDPSGVLEVFLPMAVMKATRNSGHWCICTKRSGVISALIDNGWRKAGLPLQAKLGGAESSPAPKAVAPAAKPVVKKAKPQAKSKAPATDLSLLDSSVKVIEKLIRTGTYDNDLQALLDAENAGKTRKSVVSLLEERMGK